MKLGLKCSRNKSKNIRANCLISHICFLLMFINILSFVLYNFIHILFNLHVYVHIFMKNCYVKFLYYIIFFFYLTKLDAHNFVKEVSITPLL